MLQLQGGVNWKDRFPEVSMIRQKTNAPQCLMPIEMLQHELWNTQNMFLLVITQAPIYHTESHAD
jgi:hypothetical protein